MNATTFKFGKFNISTSEIFYESTHCVGLVNLKPIAPGHVLVVPKRIVLRYAQLNMDEVIDLTESATAISKVLESEYPEMRNGCIWLIQDGKDAGQTISHVHLHIIPKRFSEWCENDIIEDVNRVSRTANDMRQEAERLKIKFHSGVA